MGRFTKPRAFAKANVSKMSAKRGVYEVGTYRSSGHGRSKKKVFVPKYVGKAEGKGGIRGRLQCHLRGDGNKDIGKYLDSHKRNNLYVRQKPTRGAAKKEAEIIKKEKPEYNHRQEHKPLEK